MLLDIIIGKKIMEGIMGNTNEKSGGNSNSTNGRQQRHDGYSGNVNSRNNTSRVTNGGKSGSPGHKGGRKDGT